MLFQTDNEFLEELKDGKEIYFVDKQNESHRDNENISDNETKMSNGKKDLRIKDYVETSGSNDFFKSQIISRASKASGKCSSWFNLRNLDDDAVTIIDWETVKEWKLISNKEVSLSSHKNL